jgi:hypothetical protein
MVVAKVVAEVVFASKWFSDFLARLIIARILVFLVQRGMNVPVMSLEVRRPLKNLLFARRVLTGKHVLLGVSTLNVSVLTARMKDEDYFGLSR